VDTFGPKESTTAPAAIGAAPQDAASFSPWPNRIIFLLSLIGLFVAGYLWSLHVRNLDAPCVAGGSGCNDVLRSPYAKFPVGSGPPVAAYGALGYLALLGLAVARAVGMSDASDPAVRAARDRVLLGLIVLAAAGGAAFSLRLTYLSLAVIGRACPWCLGSQALILGLLAAAVFDFLRRRRQDRRATSRREPLTSAESRTSA